MGEVLVAPDPVRLALVWLGSHLPSTVKVVKNRPNPLSGSVVTVRRSGGVPSIKVTDKSWLSVEIFATTDEAASDLAHLVHGLLLAMEGERVNGVQCYRAQTLGAPADMPLSDAGDKQRPRFVMSVQASFRASAIA